MTRSGVQRVYSLLGARWYDPFRALWVHFTSPQAEWDLDSLFRRYVTPQTKILDLGCGTGANMERLLRLRLPFAQYVGVDFSETMLAIAREKFGELPGVAFFQGDVTALEDAGHRYDVIVATYLLSHLRDPADFVNGVQRFLAPGGRLLLLFYSRPRWFLRFWLSPLSRLLLRADPLSREKVSRFSGVGTKKTYCAGAVTLIEIAAIAGAETRGDARTAAEGRGG